MNNVEVKVEISCDLCGATISGNTTLDDDGSIIDAESECEELANLHGYDYEDGSAICQECKEKLYQEDSEDL